MKALESQLTPVVPKVAEIAAVPTPNDPVEPVIWRFCKPGLFGFVPWVAPPDAVKPVSCLARIWQPPGVLLLIVLSVCVPVPPCPGQFVMGAPKVKIAVRKNCSEIAPNRCIVLLPHARLPQYHQHSTWVN